MDPHQTPDPTRLVGYTFVVSSLAGLTALLRSGQDITVRHIAASTLSAGLLGSGIMLVWWDWLDGRYVWFMMGVSLLAGLGGVNMIEFALQLIQTAARAYVMRVADTLPTPAARADAFSPEPRRDTNSTTSPAANTADYPTNGPTNTTPPYRPGE